MSVATAGGQGAQGAPEPSRTSRLRVGPGIPPSSPMADSSPWAGAAVKRRDQHSLLTMEEAGPGGLRPKPVPSTGRLPQPRGPDKVGSWWDQPSEVWRPRQRRYVSGALSHMPPEQPPPEAGGTEWPGGSWWGGGGQAPGPCWASAGRAGPGSQGTAPHGITQELPREQCHEGDENTHPHMHLHAHACAGQHWSVQGRGGPAHTPADRWW